MVSGPYGNHNCWGLGEAGGKGWILCIKSKIGITRTNRAYIN